MLPQRLCFGLTVRDEPQRASVRLRADGSIALFGGSHGISWPLRRRHAKVPETGL